LETENERDSKKHLLALRACQQARLCNARIIFQHINARKAASIQGDRRFQALSKSVVSLFFKAFAQE